VYLIFIDCKNKWHNQIKYSQWQFSMACCKQGQAGCSTYFPKGAFQNVGRLRVYISSVENSDNSSKSELEWISDATISSSRGLLLFFPDGFGLATHNLILADLFASRGWCTMVVDYFEGLVSHPGYDSSDERKSCTDLEQGKRSRSHFSYAIDLDRSSLQKMQTKSMLSTCPHGLSVTTTQKSTRR
jgi:hypothetical protein